jgi:ribokinase
VADWDLVVAGGANMDYLVRGERLPGPAETVPGDTFDEAPGGKGANQAVAAVRLGARVAFVGRVGRDARGDVLADRLRSEGVNTAHLGRDRDAGTGVALIMVDRRGEKQIFAAPGANGRVGADDVRAAAPVIGRSRVLLLQLELPLEAVEEAARLAKASGAAVMLDAAPPVPLADWFVAGLDVVRANAREARVITGIDVRDSGSARQAASILRSRGAKTAIVSAGEEGDLLLSPEGEELLARFDVATVDSTGAGDAFAAAIAVALSEGWRWSDAGRWASAAAALKTTRLGAQAGLPRREEVLRFLAERGVSLSVGRTVG